MTFLQRACALLFDGRLSKHGVREEARPSMADPAGGVESRVVQLLPALLSHFGIDALEPGDIHRAIHQVVGGERRVFADARSPLFTDALFYCPLSVLRVRV